MKVGLFKENEHTFVFSEDFNSFAKREYGFEISHGFFHREDFLSDSAYFSCFKDFFSLKQVHKNRVFCLREENLNDEIFTDFIKRQNLFYEDKLDKFYQADAILTNLKGTKICVLSSDCVPILGYCSKTKFVFAIHSGWRGAISDIFENLIIKLKENTNLTERDFDLHFIIGPSIFPENYKFGQEQMQNILNIQPEYKRFFIEQGDEIFFDVRSLVEFRLLKLTNNKIEKIEIDTFSNGNFTSFRRKLEQIKELNPAADLANIKANSFISFIEIL